MTSLLAIEIPNTAEHLSMLKHAIESMFNPGTTPRYSVGIVSTPETIIVKFFALYPVRELVQALTIEKFGMTTYQGINEWEWSESAQQDLQLAVPVNVSSFWKHLWFDIETQERSNYVIHTAYPYLRAIKVSDTDFFDIQDTYDPRGTYKDAPRRFLQCFLVGLIYAEQLQEAIRADTKELVDVKLLPLVGELLARVKVQQLDKNWLSFQGFLQSNPGYAGSYFIN